MTLCALDEDLPARLSRLEIEGLLEWNDDGTVRASDEATARTRLTGSERARLRGIVGRAAQSSSLPIELLAEWLLDGYRLTPDPEVVPDEYRDTYGYGDHYTWTAIDAGTGVLLAGGRAQPTGMRRFTRLTNASRRRSRT